MATSINQPALRPVPLPPALEPKAAAAAPRIEVVSAPSSAGLDSLARAAARSWRLVEHRDGGALESRWNHAQKVIFDSCRKQEHLFKAGVAISREAKWLAGNASLLRQTLQNVKGSLGPASELPHVETRGAAAILSDASLAQSAERETIPRAFAAAAALVQTVRFDLQEDDCAVFLGGVQEESPFELAELWSLRSFVELALLEEIARQAQILEAQPPMRTAAQSSLQSAPDLVVETDLTETADGPLPTLLTALRRVPNFDWKELIEEASATNRALRDDPAGAYSRMDAESRTSYCRAVAEFSAHSQWSEHEIARKAVELAAAADGPLDRARERRSHVGYYLVAEGRQILKRAIRYREPSPVAHVREAVLRSPDFFYLIGIELVTLGLMATLVGLSSVNLSGLLVVALFLLPTVECAVSIMNLFSTSLIPPKRLPKIDFSKGIGPEYATMVVIPTLLTSEEQMRHAVHALEIRFLGNRDANLHFALLTDPPDAAEQFNQLDSLAPLCSSLIDELNRKYAPENKGTFFHFHRNRLYNSAEKIWMGWERKRGKLLDFNRLLLDQEDNFAIKTGDLSLLGAIQYVITLDLDTQLPRGAAQRLIGAMAHPLHRAVVDPAKNTVIEGYGILQPRVGISVKSAARSRLAALFSGDTGIDVYTRAVSDVYQDLFGEGIFTGKGIYEVATFQKVLEHRFPCNAVLSHDLIEGVYARAGLLSDVEVVDDYPSHFSAFSRRKHRWVRGDWQIIFWLLPRVPDYFGHVVRNPLGHVARWKIIDNLRRSLTEFATFALLVLGWLVLPRPAAYWTLAALALIALPVYLQFVSSILRAGRSLLQASFWKNLLLDFSADHVRLFFRITFLCHQSLVTLDAVIRTIVRLTVTRRKLLEWETAAESESQARDKNIVDAYLDWTIGISFAVGALVAFMRPDALPFALPFLALWASSKLLCRWLNLPRPTGDSGLAETDAEVLRDAALRTWRFFREFSTAEENWLIPDIVQQSPPLVAHRVSTTNLGLLLDARLAALDLGFTTLDEFADITEKTLHTAGCMPQHKGHLYNWYDTRTLEPVRPMFISSVDNGNLLCCLWTLKQGCLQAADRPLFSSTLWQGLQDHVRALDGRLTRRRKSARLASANVDLLSCFTPSSGDGANWIEALPAFESSLAVFQRKIETLQVAPDVQWWSRELAARIAALKTMTREFLPWLVTPFPLPAELRAIVKEVSAGQLTLASAPAIYAQLDAHLARCVESSDDADEDGVRSAAVFLRARLVESRAAVQSLSARLSGIAASAGSMASAMDFTILFNAKKNIFSIGYDADKEAASEYHYDLLASEARAALFAAIAKGDITQEAWFSLGRTHSPSYGQRTLLSWTGTMFEYLMPSLWMKSFPDTVLDRSARAAIRVQRRFARKKHIPWGVSESSSSEQNSDGFYRYQAFGIPSLRLKADATSHDLVISPYSSFLALQADHISAVRNLRRLASMGAYSAYGFYESLDFTPSRAPKTHGFSVVRTWMAHHQGMSLLAVANALCDSSMQHYFHSEPAVAATERLLQEKLPRLLAMASASASSQAIASPSLGPKWRSLPLRELWRSSAPLESPLKAAH
ncbi:MAG: glucoamylase family protein [Candidatus Acidiferrales bacterium]